MIPTWDGRMCCKCDECAAVRRRLGVLEPTIEQAAAALRRINAAGGRTADLVAQHYRRKLSDFVNAPERRAGVMQPISESAFFTWVQEQQQKVDGYSKSNAYLDRLQAAIDTLEEVLEDDDDNELDLTDKRIMSLRLQEIRILAESNI